ncbi:MAG: GNAT family N-acetyltransferase [Chitinophagaceae bacterium]
MQIRKATIADIETIQSISKITWEDTYTFLPNGQMEFMLDWMYSTTSLQQQMQNGHQFFVAEFEDNIVGFASTSIQESNIYKLNKLYVLPLTQKTGAGKALLQRVIAFVKENGGKEIQLQVNRNNNAKDFYLKHGFTILYEADFEIGNGYFMNDYVMGLQLS